jgi:hypothetical protein
MDTLINQFLENWKQVYTLFGAWGIALVALIFGLMIPVNYGYVKLFALIKKGDKKLIERARKTASAVSVFLVSMALIALFTAFISKSVLTFNYVFQASIPCGLCAMLLRFVYKGGRDSINAFISKVKQSQEFKNSLANVVKNKTLATLITEYLDDVELEYDTAKVEEKAEKQAQITKDLQSKLTGFADNPAQSAMEILKLFTEKLTKKNDKVA